MMETFAWIFCIYTLIGFVVFLLVLILTQYSFWLQRNLPESEKDLPNLNYHILFETSLFAWPYVVWSFIIAFFIETEGE